LRALVAPSTGQGFNTLGERLIPKGCFRLEDVLFEFDSSFVRPEIKAAMPELKELRDRHKQGDVFPPLSIFGHGDPVGNDDYNKRLSGRRAQAIYGMLVRDEAMWEDLFSHPAGGDQWGTVAVPTMLDALGHTSGSEIESVRSFQSEEGLAVDGVAGPKTRKALFRAYMDFLCGPDLELDKQNDFLGRHGDTDGKADFQGCGEFNPIRMFSQEENTRFENAANKTERNRENQPNRRVMILLFAPGRRVNPTVWPCPRAKEGVADCKRRFFPDVEQRRSFQEERREFEKTKDTFACRFYQVLSDDSPCEAAVPFALKPLTAGRLPSQFSVGRTFPKPSALPMLRAIAKRSGDDPKIRVLVVGHTDQPGDDSTNQKLSLARAEAVRALLVGNASLFRQRFESPDPVTAWDFEEVQWMLSATELDGDPFYVGFVDGHYASITRRALGTFQIAHSLEPNSFCDESTLTALIQNYLDLIGSSRPLPSQVEVVGGGSWHIPRVFGKGGQPLTGPLFEGDDRPGFRRVEVFLGSEPFRPPVSACKPARHSACSAYRIWCDSVKEELNAQQNFTLTLRIMDEDLVPLGDQAVDLFHHEGDDAGQLVASLTTTTFGVLRLSVPPGLYHIQLSVSGEDHSAAFIAHPDEVGGLSIRLPAKVDRVPARRAASSRLAPDVRN
jgi:outer membrane protein OmpA-like peptidoglycan-associated protein